MYKVAIALLLIAAVSAETFDSNQNMYENPWVKDQDNNWHVACHRSPVKGDFMQQAVRGRNDQENLAVCIGFKNHIVHDSDCEKSASSEIKTTAVNFANIQPYQDTKWCVEQCDGHEVGASSSLS